ncbi:Aste57867_13882 [Aphanomyces stellatus]|uniref:Aste57867_13882 protein n=1 Tax=Aphanomyces stellatus TaxID=120398 RepID=A0A485KZM5_9STRA|nr:hypothetical protein As57867_013831 [Aphanomyces stellatus]VFT90713.1 Aste57867_13882 [Aphanomyces stellatus]
MRGAINALVAMLSVATACPSFDTGNNCRYSHLPNGSALLVSNSTKGEVCIVDNQCRALPSTATYNMIGDMSGSKYPMAFVNRSNLTLVRSTVFPTGVTDLTFKNVGFAALSEVNKWPGSLGYLRLEDMTADALPTKLPLNMTFYIRNTSFVEPISTLALRTAIQLTMSHTKVQMEPQDWTVLSDLEWSNVTIPSLNVRLHRTFSDFNVYNITIGNLTMDKTSFQYLNNTIAFVSEDSTIGGGTCPLGTLTRLWAHRNMTQFTACVLDDPTTGINHDLNLNPNLHVGSTSNTALLVGLVALGLLVVAAAAVLLTTRRKYAAMQRDFELSQAPVFPADEESGVKMDALTPFRLDVTALTLKKVLGTGAFAEVWLGTLAKDAVAVKKLKAKNVTIAQLISFVEEITLMTTFDSPYIVKLIGACWTHPADIKCVMELMDGGDLRDYLADHTPAMVSWTEKYQHMLSIAEGLVYLHSMDVIHRDLKSRNVLLSSTGGAKLTDFGISKIDVHGTMTLGVGTCRWMAPEVIEDKEYTISADIYSFGKWLSTHGIPSNDCAFVGMILSELDTHEIPYFDFKNQTTGDSVSDSAIMVKVVTGSLKPTFTTSCPHWVRDLAMSCLALKATDRPEAVQVVHHIRTKLRELAK